MAPAPHCQFAADHPVVAPSSRYVLLREPVSRTAFKQLGRPSSLAAPAAMQATRLTVSRPAHNRAASRPGASARRAAVAPRAAAAAPGSQQAPSSVPVTFNLNHKASRRCRARMA